MVELTEVMRQRGHHDLIRVLNKIREGNIDVDVKHTLNAQFLETKSYPKHAVHMFAENKPVKSIMNYAFKIQLIKQFGFTISLYRSIDEFPKNINVSDSQIDAIKLRKISETRNLENQLNLEVGSQVTLMTVSLMV